MYYIRKALPGDARGIAEVQVDSYRMSYAGLFPETYIERFSYEEQQQEWLALLKPNPEDVLMVAVSMEKNVIGYVLATAFPEIHLGYEAEIVALHVQKSYQRNGVGKSLLKNAIEELVEQECTSVMLWTLQGNPVRMWYERLQGKLIAEKCFQVEGWEIVEVAFGWEEISDLVNILATGADRSC